MEEEVLKERITKVEDNIGTIKTDIAVIKNNQSHMTVALTEITSSMARSECKLDTMNQSLNVKADLHDLERKADKQELIDTSSLLSKKADREEFIFWRNLLISGIILTSFIMILSLYWQHVVGK
jgi:hypothetical protein